MSSVNMGTVTLNIEVTPVGKGFQVVTFNTSSNLPGSGFKRDHGVYSMSDLVRELAFTEEPFRVILK